MFAGRALLLELDVGPLDVRARQFRYLQPLYFFSARLHLARTRAGGKAGNEFVQLRNLLLALCILRFDLRSDLGFRHHHIVIGARVSDDGLVVDVGDVGADAVEEVAVVRDHDHHAVVLVKKSLQPVDGIQVEVVRWFVEQQSLGMPKQGLRQQHADFLSALQFAHLAFVSFIGNVQALQQDRGIAFRRVAVFLAYDPFQFPQLHAVFV